MGKYKYLLWDIDGTVLSFAAAEKAAIKKLFLQFGFGECTDEMLSRYSAINSRYWKALELKQITREELLVARFRDFFMQEGLDESKAEQFNEAYQPALGDTVVFCDNSYELLKKQKQQGLVLAAVTNGTAVAQLKKLKLSGLDKVFDYVFISEDVGHDKPSVEFISKVFDTMGISSLEEVLIIGDSLTSDVKGGINAGIDSCFYNHGGIVNDTEIIPTYEIRKLDELESII